MANLQASLRKRLKDAEGVAVLAVGSMLRGDDAAGLLAAEELQGALAGKSVRARVAFFAGDTVPENLTGEIKKFHPTHLLILDAVDFARKAGEVQLLDPDVPTNNFSLSTHTLPFSVLATYLRGFFPCEIVVIGIQPSTRGFGRAPSKQVLDAAKRVSDLIVSALM